MTTVPETYNAVVDAAAIAQVLTDPEARAAHMKARAVELAQARATYQRLYEERQSIYEEWVQEHVELLDAVSQASANVQWLESAIRSELETCWRLAKAENPDKPAKTFAPGLGVRVSSELTYHEIPALAWCKHYMPLLVETIERVKAKAFAALVESTPDLLDNEARQRINPQRVETVTPTIAKDLTKMLPRLADLFPPDEPDAADIAAAEADATAAAEAYDVHQYETNKELPF